MNPDKRFILHTKPPLAAGSSGTLRFTYRPQTPLPPGARLWLMYDIRQGAGAPQGRDSLSPNYVSASAGSGTDAVCDGYGARTLDLYPTLPEFLHVCEIALPQGMAQDDALAIALGAGQGAWAFPKHPIDPFRFWLVEGGEGQRFEPTGYKTYRDFGPPHDLQDASDWLLAADAAFEGPAPRLSAENRRPTPGILWGDIHGMAFNQRPLGDFYEYAREVSGFDFAAAMLFSYNVCVGDMWAEVKQAAARATRAGEFVGIAGVEFGTPPDSSHRNAHFFNAEGVPPIFFEDRPPALDPRFTARLHPETVFCRDLDHFYATVRAYGGIVSGHFHTLRYDREILAELWQKQAGSAGEEGRIFGLLNRGMRLGLVGGSDTHDSMPGNPEPEPGCPQAAGLMAVLADQADPERIRQAVLDRRVYATTGARIALGVDAEGRPMGSVMPHAAPRVFQVRAEGAARLKAVELIRRGAIVDGVEPSHGYWEGSLRGCDEGDESDAEWYVVRVTQEDGHRAWSSPIWFEDI